MLDEEVVEPHKYDKFLHTNGVPYAFLEVPVAFLNEVIPEGANWSDKGDEENPEQKNVGEYTLGKIYSLDNTKVIITIGATRSVGFRGRSVNYDDVQDWETWLNTKGYTIDDWLTIEERNSLLATEAYGLGDE